MWRILLIFFCSIIDYNSFVNAQGCSITLNSLETDQPLLLKPLSTATDISAFLNPAPDGKIYFNIGDTFTFSCPGSFISQPDKSVFYNQLPLTCTVNGFMYGREVFNVDQSTCTNEIIQYTNQKCLNNYDEMILGFFVPDGRLLVLMKLCFDVVKKNALYSSFILSQHIGGCVTSFPRVNFDAHLYGISQEDVDNLYKKVNQQAIVNTQLGLPPTSIQYINPPTNFYLAKGHLTAKCDFTFGSQQKMTFYYVNTAPQWQTMNVGNWKTLEGAVRAYVQNQKKDFIVFTGTYGVTTLKNLAGVETEIFLHTTGGVQEMPVPALFWKVLYDSDTKTGFSFLVINNPYQNSYIPICTNTCPNKTNPIPLNWKKTDQKQGFAYCCDLHDFQRVVPIVLP